MQTGRCGNPTPSVCASPSMHGACTLHRGMHGASRAPVSPPPRQEFLFALTGGKGDRLYGFCRLSLPPVPKGTTLARYPQALCIVSPHPWSTFMFRVRGSRACACVHRACERRAARGACGAAALARRARV